MAALKPGHVIGGCVLESVIAEGGMGAVYKARRQRDGVTVAVKVLRAEAQDNEKDVSRFLREGLLASSLNHPSVIRIYRTDREKGHYYMVMEYLVGMDLMKIVRADGPLPMKQALEIARQAAEALDYAHERGILHRDIKPGNLMLTTDGQVKITDFGIACFQEQESFITREGEIVGTPAYMSPEQCRGDPIDGRSDLYSLGATLYTLLSGNPPFRGGGPSLVHKIINEQPPSLRVLMPELDERCVRLVQRMMAKHPGARLQRGAEVVAAADEILHGKSPPPPAPREVKGAEAIAEASGWVKLACKVVIALVAASTVAICWPMMTSSSGSKGDGPQAAPDSTAPAKAAASPAALVVEPRRATRGVEDLERAGLEAPALLARRLGGFQQALREGRVTEALTFLVPGERGDPRALSCLWGVANTVQTMDLSEVRPAAVRRLDAGRVLVRLAFTSPLLEEFAAEFEFLWLHRGGAWEVHLLAP